MSIEPYKSTDGSYYSYRLYSSNLKSGNDMIEQLTKLKGGKKRYSYSYNGISNYIHKKSHKTRRTKTHLFRRFLKNPVFKKNRTTKKTYKKKYERCE